MLKVREQLKSIPGLVPLVRFMKGKPMTSKMPRGWILENIPQCSVGAEIGVYEGDFAAQILRQRNPDTIHLIDPWIHVPDYEGAWYGGPDTTQKEMDRKHERVKKRFDSEISTGQVKVHREKSENVVDAFGDFSLDWVYIDGNHLYECVLQDLRDYSQKVKPSGLVMGDDYGSEGWWNDGMEEDGVQRAVDEFVQERGLHLQTFGPQFIIRSR